MPSRLPRGGLRAQLALAIALITAAALGVTFLAVSEGTDAELRDRIDEDLATQVTEWEQMTVGQDLSTPEAVERAARRFIAAQGYHSASRVFAIDVAGGDLVTNHPDLLEDEIEREEEDDEDAEHRLEERRERHEPGERDEEDEHEPDDDRGEGLLAAPEGLSTVLVKEAGTMRVTTAPIERGGRRVGTLRVADPLEPTEDAQESLLRTFAVVGVVALLLAVLAGVAIAALIARPLRRMASVAAAVEAGDLSWRVGPVRARGEIAVLAHAFDTMLDRLERSFRRQRDFVSDASHELRTPLSVLRAQVELLARETGEERRREATRTLLRRLDEMDRLVSDMLTLASAEAGRLVEPRPVDLADFFEDLRRDLPLFGDRDWEVEPVGGVVDADPDRLTQVLRNLVRNAVAHTGPGDRISIRADADGSTLRIAVSDTGPGIAPEHLEHVFERFYRADGARSRDRGGSGLGLAIARAVVEAHGGRIRADSRLGEGTTFTIELPGYRADGGR